MDIDPLVSLGHNHQVLSKLKLGGTNYAFWQFKMTTILDSYQLLDTMIRIDTVPMGTLDPENPTVVIPPMTGGWMGKHRAGGMCTTYMEVLWASQIQCAYSAHIEGSAC